MTVPMERLAGWLGTAGVSDAGGGRLNVQGSGAPLTVGGRGFEGGLELAATWSAPGDAANLDLASLAHEPALSRPGLVRCEADSDPVRISAPLFADGITRQSFVATAHDVAKAYEV